MLVSLRRKIGDLIYYAVRRRLLSDLEPRVAEPEQRVTALPRPGRELLERVYASTRRVEPNGQPIIDPLAVALREIANVRWNVKVLGAALASNLYEAGLAGAKADIPPNPTHVGLQSKLCTQADIESGMASLLVRSAPPCAGLCPQDLGIWLRPSGSMGSGQAPPRQ